MACFSPDASETITPKTVIIFYNILTAEARGLSRLINTEMLYTIKKAPQFEELFFLSAIAMAKHSVQIISPQPYEPLSYLGHRLSSRCRVP